MLDSAPMEKSGLAVSHEQPKAFTSDKDHLHCDYCGKPRHTKETCWKLHGRPTRGRGGKRVGPSRVQANIAEIVETSRETASGEALFSDEIQHLYRLLNKLDSSNVATSNYVQSDPKWKQAMIEEMNALSKNKTWELVTSPPDKKFVCCKWVFTVKHKADGSIERFKAKLVAKGFTQTYGVDYQETFGPCCQNEHYQNHFVLCS
uniref:Uncharacterized protein LOC104212904 isoform X3 n=1 Tax=Nicotiana sylvestris TaxID=4096 RepID=A0A1U7UX07_NICSY|nr:PREDICTED: uncharacterized protein LOC104212904 isoform X3 [Nicotiana sylvestris]